MAHLKTLVRNLPKRLFSKEILDHYGALASLGRPKLINCSLPMNKSFRYIHSCISNYQGISEKLSENRINSARICDKAEMLIITFSDNSKLEYPILWLRDNCQCMECFNPHMNSRIIHWKYFDINSKPIQIAVQEKGLRIKWNNNHESFYSVGWLLKRSFEDYKQKQWKEDVYRNSQILWNKQGFTSVLRKYSFTDILNSDKHLLSWLLSLAVYGVAIVGGAPCDEHHLRKLANRVSFIKKTHYGEEFIVKAKPDTTNSAYQSTPLQMHTDLPYYEYKPGINMLHCLVQAKGDGGDNQLSDCFYIAEKLRKTQPDVYKILSTCLINWSDIGREGDDTFYSLYQAPVICEDYKGNVIRINYSQPQRDSFMQMPIEQVTSWYKAYKIFTDEIYNDENIINLKTKPGEILTFDNIRLVHGRSGYEDILNSERFIVGCYVDWDIAYSRIRILKRNNVVPAN